VGAGKYIPDSNEKQKGEIPTHDPLSTAIGEYEPEGSSLLSFDTPRWGGE